MKTKVCTLCNKRKQLSEFRKRPERPLGTTSRCTLCLNKNSREYAQKHAENRKLYDKKIYLKNKLHKPWYKHLKAGRQRCNDKNASNYKYYGARKINFLLTIDEIKILWFRDKAYLMKEAQLSRKNHNKNYVFDNCEFIEKKANVGERNKRVAKEKRKLN